MGGLERRIELNKHLAGLLVSMLLYKYKDKDKLTEKGKYSHYKMAPYSLSGAVQVSVNPEIIHWLEKTLFTIVLKLKSSLLLLS